MKITHSITIGYNMSNKALLTAYSKRLDKLANTVQGNPSQFGLSPKKAQEFCLQVDHLSDRIDALARRADVLQREEDEPHLEYFDIGVVENEHNNTHIHHFEDATDAETRNPLEGGPTHYSRAASRRSQAAWNWYAAEQDEDDVEETEEDLEEVLEEGVEAFRRASKKASARRSAPKRYKYWND